jgi:hypothetical protein
MNSTPPKGPPRFLPTLTEVVHPSDLGAAHQAVGLQNEQLVREVMRRLNSSLEVRLREAIGTVVVEQVQMLAPRLRQEIEMVVRQVVAEALGDQPDA